MRKVGRTSLRLLNQQNLPLPLNQKTIEKKPVKHKRQVFKSWRNLSSTGCSSMSMVFCGIAREQNTATMTRRRPCSRRNWWLILWHCVLCLTQCALWLALCFVHRLCLTHCVMSPALSFVPRVYALVISYGIL